MAISRVRRRRARPLLALAGIIAAGCFACAHSQPPNPNRYRLIESGSHWDVSGEDRVLDDVRGRYPEFFDIILDEQFRAPLVSDVRTLFLSGSLDWNTPPQQAEEVRWGFSNGTHLVVENAGHEQVLTHPLIQDAMQDFLRGKDVRRVNAAWPAIKFAPIKGYDPEVTHPALARR